VFTYVYVLACYVLESGAVEAIRVSIHGVLRAWLYLIAGSGGSQGFPSMAARMASIALTPWAAAESR